MSAPERAKAAPPSTDDIDSSDIESQEEIVDELDLYCQTSRLCSSTAKAAEPFRVTAGTRAADADASTALTDASASTPAGSRRTLTSSSSCSSSSSLAEHQRLGSAELQQQQLLRRRGSAHSSSSSSTDGSIRGKPLRRRGSTTAFARCGTENFNEGVTEAIVHHDSSDACKDRRKAPPEGRNGNNNGADAEVLIDPLRPSPREARRVRAKGSGIEYAPDDVHHTNAHVREGEDKKTKKNAPGPSAFGTTQTHTTRPLATDSPLSGGALGNWGAATTLPAAEAPATSHDGPYRPPLMPEFDGELLQIIKNYYLRKKATVPAPSVGAAASLSASILGSSTELRHTSPAHPEDSSTQLFPSTLDHHNTNHHSTLTATNADGLTGHDREAHGDVLRRPQPAWALDNFITAPRALVSEITPASGQHGVHSQEARAAAQVPHSPHPHQQLPAYSQSASFVPEYNGNARIHHTHVPLQEEGGISGSGLSSAPLELSPRHTLVDQSASSDAFARTPPTLQTPTPSPFVVPRGYAEGHVSAALSPSSLYPLGGSGAVPMGGGYAFDARPRDAGRQHTPSHTAYAASPFPAASTESPRLRRMEGGVVRQDPHSGGGGGGGLLSYGVIAGGMSGGDGSGGMRRLPGSIAAGLVGSSGAAAAAATSSGTSSGGGGSFGGGLASGLSALSSLPTYSSTSFVRAYVSDISLSLEPAIIVSALTAALNIVVVVFLQHHVLDTRDHLGLFLIGSYMIFASYYMIYYFLERFSGSFRRIASQDKKFYIIGNLIKAGILVSITPFACIHLVKIIVFDEWESNILRNLGCIYAIPDFISMVIVRRMRWSTWVHHACVVVFNYFSIMNNYQHENVCRCVVVYAAFSSFAYCVNVLLASRFLGVSVNVARVLSFVALVVYALCCAVNWAWQVYYLRRLLTSGHDHWTVYMYMFLISLVMWDDIVLNKWLLHHARNNAYAASQHLQQHRMRQQQQQQQQQQQRPSPLFRSQEERQPPMSLQRPSPRAL